MCQAKKISDTTRAYIINKSTPAHKRMSLFGTQFTSGRAGEKKKLGVACCAPSLPCQPKKKTVLLNKCDKHSKSDCCCVSTNCNANCSNDDDNNNTKCAWPADEMPPQTAFIEGVRVLRPWALDDKCDPCRPPPKPKCTEDEACHNKRSKVLECRATECGSAIVKLLVHGGPEQTLTMFIDLPQCEEPCDEVTFNARYLIVGEGKCQLRCEVPCEFAVFIIDKKKGTPSGVHLTLCFVKEHAPAALLKKEGVCCCYVPFCIEFEVWRRCPEECCLDVETIVPEPLPPGASIDCEQ